MALRSGASETLYRRRVTGDIGAAALRLAIATAGLADSGLHRAKRPAELEFHPV